MQPHVPTLLKLPAILLTLLPFTLLGQQPGQPDQPAPPKVKKEHHSIGIGIKAGLNFANVTNASSINSSTRAGYHIGAFFSTDPKRIIGSHTELLYSRHGFNYKNDSVNGSVNLDYLMFTQMIAINITKYFQIQLGGTTSYLLNVKSDSSRYSTGNASADKLLSYYNRFDYGFAGGIEIHPIAGLLIGVRYCLSFANLYKQSTFTGGGSFTTPSVNFKNNVVQLSVGYRF
jgi:hypothetical protein